MAAFLPAFGLKHKFLADFPTAAIRLKSRATQTPEISYYKYTLLGILLIIH